MRGNDEEAIPVSEVAQEQAEAAVFVKVHLSTNLSQTINYRKATISVAKAINFVTTSTYALSDAGRPIQHRIGGWAPTRDTRKNF